MTRREQNHPSQSIRWRCREEILEQLETKRIEEKSFIERWTELFAIQLTSHEENV